MVSFITFFIICLNSQALFVFVMVKIDGENYCIPRDQFLYFASKVWPLFDAIMYNFLPFGIIIICNIIIISVVLKSARNRRKMTTRGGDSTNDDSASDSNSETNRMTRMLLTISFFFILTTTPISMYLMFAKPNAESEVVYSENRLGFVLCNMVASLNHSCNFIMYSVSGPTFRAELFRILRCTCAREEGLASSRSVSRATLSTANGGINS